MSEGSSAIANMQAITISREYGCGGGEIAARLAKRLGWQLIDHEVVVRVAQKMHVSEEEALDYDERADSLALRILQSFQMIQPITPVSVEFIQEDGAQAFFKARCQVIDGAFVSGQVVIVGRGAQAHLRTFRNVLHARIVAPLEVRIEYVMSREGLKREAARARILKKDQEHTQYLQTFYHCDPHDPHLYDLVVNTGAVDLESTVDVIELVLERKALRLTVPTQEIGPVVGLPHYPGRPEDFHPRKT